MTKSVPVTRPVGSYTACIPSNYSRLIARVLELQEADLPALLDMTQLNVDQFMQEETLLTAPQQIQILSNALCLSNDDAFGLRLGARLTPPTHGAMGFLVNSSPNLLTAINAIQTYLPTRMNIARVDFTPNGDWLEGHCYFDVDLSPDIYRCLSEAFAKILFDCAEFIVGKPVHDAISFFNYAEPSYSQSYADYLPGQFEFSAPSLMVRIPMALCEIPNASSCSENYLFAMRQCETMQAQLLSNRTTLKYQVQKMMLDHPPGVLTETEAAAALFICKRTLSRRLKKENTGFRQIREEILSQQAADYLRDSTMSIDTIAALLNYHDSANFRRAFKRWFQLSPDQYRQSIRQSSR